VGNSVNFQMTNQSGLGLGWLDIKRGNLYIQITEYKYLIIKLI